jgi:hypothetical protein
MKDTFSLTLFPSARRTLHQGRGINGDLLISYMRGSAKSYVQIVTDAIPDTPELRVGESIVAGGAQVFATLIDPEEGQGIIEVTFLAAVNTAF